VWGIALTLIKSTESRQKNKQAPTLSLRLTKLIAILTFSLFFIFSIVTFVVAYSIEDSMFNQQLQQASKSLALGRKLPDSIIKKSDLSEFDMPIRVDTQLSHFESEALFGEFSFNGKHYHYMNNGLYVLIIDVTDLGMVSRAFSDILLLLLIILIPCLFLSYFIANKLSQHALKPFYQLTDIFRRKEIKKELIDDIEESDINAIACQLHQAIEDKNKGLEQQIIFNKGMSHEVRTPLQVIEHSVELITTHNPELSEQESVKRLLKALDRIKRTSNALLWLNSDEKCSDISNVEICVKKVIAELEDLLAAHNLQVQLVSNNQLFMKIPAVVLELIFYNLINNAIQHSAMNEKGKFLSISIDENNIEFINAQGDVNDLQSQSFGLGIQIVSNFAQRFQLDFKVESAEGKYCASLKNNQAQF